MNWTMTTVDYSALDNLINHRKNRPKRTRKKTQVVERSIDPGAPKRMRRQIDKVHVFDLQWEYEQLIGWVESKEC